MPPNRRFGGERWLSALEIWDVLRQPSSVFALGILVLAGFAAGIVFWGAFNTALEFDQYRAVLRVMSRNARKCF